MKTTGTYLVRMIAAAGCLLWSLHVSAQQKPHYTQYILNQYIVNPAISGIENYTDIKISHRHQWVGIDGAPVSTYVTIHAPIGKNDFRTTATSYSTPGENPRGRSYWENYVAAEPHHGVGLQVINDVTGPLSRFSAYGTYAYHLGISPRTSIAAGFGLGLTKLTLDVNKLDIYGTDPAISDNISLYNKLRPDLNAGVYMYSSDFFIGVSAQQIIPAKLEFSEDAVKETDGRFVPHLFATAGYRLLLTEDINFIPSVMVKYINPVPVQYEVNGKFQYRDLAWLGAGWRKDDGFTAMAGLNVSNIFNVGYSYDYTTSGLNTHSKGTHEVVLGFLIGNSYGDTCPRNVW